MADDFLVEIPQTVGDNPNQLAYRNNNPGNIEFNNQPGATLGEDGRFAKFPTPEDGYKYLRDVHIPKHAAQPLGQYISQYAPPNENNTARYIADAAKATGATPDTPVGQIDREKLAQFQIQKESQAKVVPHDEFDKVIHGDEFDQVIHGKAEVKPGQIPLPPPNGVRRPGSWDPKLDTLENISNQAEDILPSVARNVGGMISSAGDVVKGIFHRETPEETRQKLQDWNKPLGQQLHDVPALGPLLEQRYGAAVGDVATGALLGKLGKVGKGVEVEPPPLSDADLINQQILQKVNEVRTARADRPELKQPTREADYQAAAKPLTEALSPANAADFKDVTSRRLLPLLKEEEGLSGGFNDPKTVVPNMERANEIAKTRNRLQFQPYVDSAEAHGLELPGDEVARRMKASVPEQLRFEHPDIAAKMDADADAAYAGKTLRPSQVEKFIQSNNAKRAAYFDAKGDVQNAQSLTQAEKAVTLAQLDAYHDLLYKSIDPSVEGANVAELQKRYGALAEGSKYISNLKDKLAAEPTQAPFFGGTLKDKARVLNQGIKALEGIANPADPKRFLNLIPEETTQEKLVRSMRSYPKESSLKDIPMADPKDLPITWNLEHPGAAEFTRQQGINEQQLPGSRMDTDFRQQYQDLPVHQAPMSKTPNARMDWQRNLFPESRERPVLPKINKKPNPASRGNASATPPNVENESPWRY